MTESSNEAIDLKGPRKSLREEARGMRGLLIFTGLLVMVIVIAIGVALIAQDSGNGAPEGDIQASTVNYAIHMPTHLATGHHTIGLTNKGTVGHEIVIFKTTLPADQLPLDKSGDVIEDSPQLQAVADSGDALPPGKSKSMTTEDLTPGHYVAVCNLPGHYRLGMSVDLTVS
jgi:hypothetical protein